MCARHNQPRSHTNPRWTPNQSNHLIQCSCPISSSLAKTVQLTLTKKWLCNTTANSHGALSNHRHVAVAAVGSKAISGKHTRSSHTGEVAFISLYSLPLRVGGIKLSGEPTLALITAHKGSSLSASIHSAFQPEITLPCSSLWAGAFFVFFSIRFTAYQLKDNKDKAARDLMEEVEEIYTSSCSLIAASRAS